MNRLAFANARAFDRAQTAYDNATPDDDESPDYKEQAGTELMRTGGVIADELSKAAVGPAYDQIDPANIGLDFYGMSAVQLLAVMADGTAAQATAALMQWRMLLPELLKNIISERAAELAKEDADSAEEAKVDAYLAGLEYAA